MIPLNESDPHDPCRSPESTAPAGHPQQPSQRASLGARRVSWRSLVHAAAAALLAMLVVGLAFGVIVGITHAFWLLEYGPGLVGGIAAGVVVARLNRYLSSARVRR